MGWRFRKSIKIAPGIKINLGKKGISSVSFGGRGAHINVGKRGTNLTTGIPGTGLYNVTRLDKPAGSGMTQCPYCGHQMRKQWDACPKCHAPLVQQISQPEAGSGFSNANAVANDTSKKLPKENNGCGCLILILLLVLIGACMSGTTTKKPAGSSGTSTMTETASSAAGSPSSASVPAPSSRPESVHPANAAADSAPNQPENEKKYYGNGPNGEGIKGHIDKKTGSKTYHLPGSTYYSRTTHVSQWFFTEQEARAAGYQAASR